MSHFDVVATAARRQHGVVSMAQLSGGGLSRRQVRTLIDGGILARAAPGVLVATSTPDTWQRRLLVAVLAAGPSAVASHRSAAALWRLDRFRPGPPEVTVPRGERRAPGEWRVHESARLPSRDVNVVGAIPVTTPARTLIDVARFLPEHRLGRMVDDAVRRDLTSYEHLHQRVAELAERGRDGIGRIRSVLDERPGGAEVPDSVLEAEVRSLLMTAGLPEPTLHHPVTCDDITYVVDLAWPTHRVGIECDGFRFHRTPEELDWDDRRRTRLTLAGWSVLHTTWNVMRRDPTGLVDDVRRALDDR